MLRDAGAEVVSLMPLRLWGPNAARFDLRNHRKIVVVDGACAYFGSQNIVSAHANRGMVNEEMLVRATGPIVRHLHAVLLGDRYLETGTLPPESDDLTPAPPSDAMDGLAQVVPSGPGYNEGTAEAVMIALMYGARTRVVLTSPYVIPSEPFLSAMCSAARRGVVVDLIVDAESNKPLVQLAQQSFYDAMLRAGVIDPSSPRQLPAREAHERGRRRGADRFVEPRHPLVRAQRGNQRADLRPRGGGRPARDPGHYLAQMRPRHARRSARACRSARRALENVARLTDSLL